jgi:mono/diheme cytochrome c family protein
MTARRATGLVWILGCIAGCASAASVNVLTPLGARLTPEAATGAPIPLRIDPNAKITHSTAAGLPAATYWAAPAEHGEQVFAKTCAMCHQRTQFIGQTFVDNWNDRRVSDLYTLIRSTMPQNDPGGLKDEDYIGVVEYLLKANNAAQAPDSARPDTAALRTHRIAARGP